jgi:hypothetical protein
MWIFGCALLEIVTAVPIWMPYKILIQNLNQKKIVRHGFMAVKDRLIDRILDANFKLVKNLTLILEKHSVIPIDDSIKNALKGML